MLKNFFSTHVFGFSSTVFTIALVIAAFTPSAHEWVSKYPQTAIALAIGLSSDGIVRKKDS